MNTASRSLPFALMVAAGAMLLAGCATFDSRDSGDGRGRVTELPGESPLTQAERLLSAGRVFDAEEALAGVDTDGFSPREIHRFRLLRAELSLAAGHPLSALRDLPAPDSTPDRALAARTEALRAQVFLAMDDLPEAVTALVQRDRMLDSRSERRRNEERIWEVLTEATLDADMQSRFAGTDRVTRGWFELALIARGAVPGRTDTQLRNWRTRFPDHPGTPELAQRTMTERRGAGWARIEDGGPIAVLLPEYGDLAPLGDAIRAAFMAAWEEQPAPRPPVRFYDSGDYPEDIRRVVDRAANDGAALIVGPVRRDHVNHLAQYGPLPVPVLALNYIDEDLMPPFNLFQFGLAPEDEARAAVRRSHAEGNGDLLTLISEADWSERVLRAVDGQAGSLGGRMLDSARIRPGSDLSDTVRGLLRVDVSEARHQALVQALGTRPEFEARPRADAGALLIVARPREAQQAIPFFAYHGASGLPVYTTALAWEGDAIPRELYGSRICDMPWMMHAEDAPWLPQREQLAYDYPDTFEQIPRLFALGHDALLLSVRLQQGWEPGNAFPGASGVLQLAEDGRIRRELGCAELTADGAKPLPPLMQRPEARRIEADTRFDDAWLRDAQPWRGD